MSMPTHMITCSRCTGCKKSNVLRIDEDGLANVTISWTCSKKRIVLDDIDSLRFCSRFEKGRIVRGPRRFEVTFVVRHTVTVEAEDEKKAEEAAIQVTNFGDFDEDYLDPEVEEVTA